MIEKSCSEYLSNFTPPISIIVVWALSTLSFPGIWYLVLNRLAKETLPFVASEALIFKISSNLIPSFTKNSINAPLIV